jgi:dephospho-CoA kinase
MLRVGLTGGLGSGKSTAAAILKRCGAHIFSADEIGRSLMQPGQAVFDRIVTEFGPRVVDGEGRLDRAEIARMVFANPAALQQLNLIVHPAVIAEQERQMRLLEEIEPEAVVVVESALIFEVERDRTNPGWKRHFDKIILLTAPDELKVARYLDRMAQVLGRALTAEEAEIFSADARRRLATQIPDDEKAAQCDAVIDNTGSLDELEQALAVAWSHLRD